MLPLTSRGDEDHVPGLRSGWEQELSMDGVQPPFDLVARGGLAANNHNLPAQLSSFVGRHQDITEVSGCFRERVF